jgi:signal transduction histidine kinase
MVRRANHSQTLARPPKTALSTDLEDNLAHIMILIEMAGRPTEKLDPQMSRRLNEISDLAIEPDAGFGTDDHVKSGDHYRYDTARLFHPPDNDLKNVIHCIQRIAGDLLADQGIRWEFAAPPDLDRINLTSEQCRQLYLIFKEAIRNIARHARCSTVSLSVSIKGRWLEVKIHDDGCSLIGKLLCQSSVHKRDGGGLRKIQMRAAELGGALEIASAFDWGTRLTLTLPLDE